MKIETKTPELKSPTKWPRLMRRKGGDEIFFVRDGLTTVGTSLYGTGTIDLAYLEDLPAGFTVTLTNE